MPAAWTKSTAVTAVTAMSAAWRRPAARLGSRSTSSSWHDQGGEDLEAVAGRGRERGAAVLTLFPVDDAQPLAAGARLARRPFLHRQKGQHAGHTEQHEEHRPDAGLPRGETVTSSQPQPDRPADQGGQNLRNRVEPVAFLAQER